MEKQPFYFELEDQLKMFLTAIDGCVAVRHDKDRNKQDRVAVRYTYAPKQRALHDLVNKAQHVTLPIVAYWIKGINYDPKREFNKIDGSQHVVNNSLRHLPQPQPIIIDVEVSVLAKYQTDIDQILSNLITYFRPYIVISWNRFNLPYHEIRNKVIWNGGVSLTYPVDINDNQPTRVTADTSFKIEGWLFKEDENATGLIRTIEASFHALSSINDNIIDLTAQVNDENTEIKTLSGNPILHAAYPTATITYPTSADDLLLTVYGSFIRGISAAYLSSSTVYELSSQVLVDAFSAISTLSADNPAFSGIPVVFEIDSENSITLTIPPPLSAGYFDVIFVNPVGYGKLTYDTTSSFASGIAVFST